MSGGGAMNGDSPMTGVEAPANLHISPTSTAFMGIRLSERVEQKFFVSPQRMAMAMALLRRTCRPDPQHPVGQVNSLYFDTFDLVEHARSDAGDFAKDKTRIRWYGDELDPHVARTAESGAVGRPVSVWLERKTRRGFSSTKQRRSVEVLSEALAPSALGRCIVPAALLLNTVASFGFFPRGRLCPVVAISYWRYRFVEPSSGFRVSIDSRIRSTIIMPGLGQGERGLELPGAVVEVKGPLFDLPLALRELADIGSTWTRYSKYSSCIDSHVATMGSVSRLWPSGMMEKEPRVPTRVRQETGQKGEKHELTTTLERSRP